MALKDRLQGERTQIEKSKQQLEEERFSGIRAQIADLGIRKSDLEAQLVALNTGYEEGKALRGEVKKKRKVVSETAQQFKDVLAEKGIESAADLLTNSEYTDEEEVKDYHTAKGAVHEKIAELKKTKNLLKAISFRKRRVSL